MLLGFTVACRRRLNVSELQKKCWICPEKLVADQPVLRHSLQKPLIRVCSVAVDEVV
jgi:hypothetical protein